MKKTRFILLWLALAPIGFLLGHLTYDLARTIFRPSIVSGAEAVEYAEGLLVSKHPDADLCMMHRPSVGAYMPIFAGPVDCRLVQDRLRAENPRYGQEVMGRMTFVRDRKTLGVCHASSAQKPRDIVVDCDLVEHLIEGERYCRASGL